MKSINYSWRLKTYKMTYILAGKLNNKPFIYVDKVVNFNPNEPSQNKLYHSITNPNITISLTGDAVLMDEIKNHDETLHQQGQVLTINVALMNQLATSLTTSYNYKDLCDNFVYVIDGNNLTRYDLKFLPNNPTQYANCTSINVKDGEFLKLAYTNIDKIPTYITDAQNFSKWMLEWDYKERFKRNEEKYDIDEYFKDGFYFYITP